MWYVVRGTGFVERGCDDAGIVEDQIRDIDGVGLFPLRRWGRSSGDGHTTARQYISRGTVLARALGWIKTPFKTGHWTVLAETST